MTRGAQNSLMKAKLPVFCGAQIYGGDRRSPEDAMCSRGEAIHDALGRQCWSIDQ